MTDFVDFNMSRLLKEKGFDKPVICFYIYDQKQCYSEKKINWNEDVGFFSRPTIAEVVMWLYDKHGIWIEVRQNDKDSFQAYMNQKYLHGDMGGYISHDEPTNAYLDAIEYTLKNLI